MTLLYAILRHCAMILCLSGLLMAQAPEPTKREKNKHALGWPDGRPSVELDAVPPAELRAMVRSCIERHVDHDQLETLKIAEESERELLTAWASNLRGAT